jgi:cyclomaltodextrinase / maltogenic alpha-amylase / neopullulanase
MAAWPDHAIWWQLHPISFTGAEPTATAPPETAPPETAPPETAPAQTAPAQTVPPGAEHGAVVSRLPTIEAWLDYVIDLGCNGLSLGPVFASESHGYDTVDHYRIDPRLGTDADFGHLAAQCREHGIRLMLDGVFNHVGRGFAPFQDVLAHGRSSAYASWFVIDFDADGPDGFGYADFEGNRNLVALNHAEPAVRDYVTGVMRHWLDRGASGWRLDAAYAVPSAFWHTVTDRVRGDHPGAWLVGEVLQGDYVEAVRDGGLDSVTQYELWKAIWSSLNDQNFFELAWALGRHNDFAAAFLPLTFVGNHDVTRIASRLDDPRHLPHALAVLFTVAGTPSVYAGDEQAFRGVKYDRAGGDAAVRPMFPASPEGLPPDGWATYRLHQDLIGLRRRHPWLARAATEVLTLQNETFGYLAASPDGGSRLAVLLNVSDDKATFPLGDQVAAGTVTQLLGSGDAAEAGGVEPHGWAILELRP